MTETGPYRSVDQARKSALVVAGVLLVLAAWNVYRGRPYVYYSLGSIAGGLGIVGLAWPRGAQLFDRAWMTFAAALGYVNSRILLSIMFYLVMTPYGLVMRMMGRNTMNRRGRGMDSYWIPRKRTRQATEQFERMF